MNIRKTDGYCLCCKEETTFIAEGYWLRDEYICTKCHSKPRNRALNKALKDIYPEYEKLRIHESSPSRRQIKLMKQDCDNYTYSYFYQDIPLGMPLNNEWGGVNENLEAMTFLDNSFDIFITQDVMEHVLNPEKVFQEIERVLDEGGIHIFTVPIYLFSKTRPRVKFDDGKLINILPPIYHGNPISKDGSLVTYDWGDDIGEFIDKNTHMKTEIIQFFHTKENYELGLEADFLQVIVSRKSKK